jgi:hypothetical protein
LGLPKINIWVGGIANPALVASPLKSIRANTVRPFDLARDSRRSIVSETEWLLATFTTPLSALASGLIAAAAIRIQGSSFMRRLVCE